jgi:hypothetical protein
MYPFFDAVRRAAGCRSDWSERRLAFSSSSSGHPARTINDRRAIAQLGSVAKFAGERDLSAETRRGYRAKQ